MKAKMINWKIFLIVSIIGLIGLLSRSNPILNSQELILYFFIGVLPFSIFASLIFNKNNK